MNYTSNMGMNMPDENDKFSIEHFNTNTQALDIVGKPDEYKNTKTYAVGDLCIHNNILYKCITAVETAEEFNAEKWEVTSLCKEEIANKTAIAELNENLNNYFIGMDSTKLLVTVTRGYQEYYTTCDQDCIAIVSITGCTAGHKMNIEQATIAQAYSANDTTYCHNYFIPLKKGQQFYVAGNIEVKFYGVLR